MICYLCAPVVCLLLCRVSFVCETLKEDRLQPSACLFHSSYPDAFIMPQGSCSTRILCATSCDSIGK
uniref:Putative secreted protein n=1 Tax=Anopheles darlingi TaxID=43151 RepID=A0A2M4DQ65_ANODA